MGLILKIFSSTNFLAVIASVVAFFLLASVWFMLFGKIWGSELEKHGIKMGDPSKGMAGKFIGTLLMQIILVLGCRIAIYITGIETIPQGIKLGLFLGVCIAGMPMAITFLCENRPLKLSLLDIAYPVIGMIISMIILSAWR